MRERLERPDQQHFFASLDDAVLDDVDVVDESAAPASLWQDAWRALRRRPIFWVSALLIVGAVVLATAPRLFTSADPLFCDLPRSLDLPEPGHPFGFDKQGCDIFARTVYGARASVTVGLLTTIFVTVVGAVVGAIAGFYGGWFDALLSRATDIFFAIPLVLAAIVVMQMFAERGVMTVVVVLAAFGWPQIARITRGAVMSVKNADFITAAKALGASRIATLVRHVVPNALAPIIVTATVSLGTFIVAEATLSYLGLGLPSSRIVSWGADISSASRSLRDQPSILFYPSGALALTVLGFIMMGDAVRDALDPKARKR